jgi:hypothetical protein
MSRNLDLLQAAYQRAGRDGVDAVVDLLDPQVEWLAAQPGPWDCHDREQILETVSADNLAEVSMPDLRGLVLAENVAARGPLPPRPPLAEQCLVYGRG